MQLEFKEIEVVPAPRVYCKTCVGKLDIERSKLGFEECGKCLPGWPRNEDGTIYNFSTKAEIL